VVGKPKQRQAQTLGCLAGIAHGLDGVIRAMVMVVLMLSVEVISGALS
jgi:hypothetical protein